jgi:hypothetical protein
LFPYGELRSIGYQDIEIKQDRDLQIPEAEGRAVVSVHMLGYVILQQPNFTVLWICLFGKA